MRVLRWFRSRLHRVILDSFAETRLRRSSYPYRRRDRSGNRPISRTNKYESLECARPKTLNVRDNSIRSKAISRGRIGFNWITEIRKPKRRRITIESILGFPTQTTFIPRSENVLPRQRHRRVQSDSWYDSLGNPSLSFEWLESRLGYSHLQNQSGSPSAIDWN